MPSNKPRKPVKQGAARESFSMIGLGLVLCAIVGIGIFGCDASEAELEVATVAADAVVAAEMEKVEFVTTNAAAAKPVTQEQETLLPLDADLKSDDADSATLETQEKTETTNGAELASESGTPAESAAEPGMFEKAGKLFGQAKSKGAAAASGTGKWVQDKLGAAADTGEKTVDDTMKWATDTFQSLKDKGLTTANDTGEWLSEDWKNMDCWEYKVLSLANHNDATMSEKLNELGKTGWDCFHVEGDRFFFKKPTHSYLRSMPFKDVIKLVPLMGAAAANNGK